VQSGSPAGRDELTFAQLFMGCVGLVFAPLAPLVTVAAAAVFWISSWVYKYQLMFVFVSQVETGGVRGVWPGLPFLLLTLCTAHVERCHEPRHVFDRPHAVAAHRQ
jgi:hypothetical protein